MTITLSNNINYSQVFKQMREENGVTQEELANMIGISRISYLKIENGKRQPKDNEIQEFLKIFELNNIKENNEKIKELDKKDILYKFKNTILYILNKCGQKPNIGKTVLNKLLYFSDFNYYEFEWKSITGEDYYKLPRGAVPKNIDKALDEMIKDKQISQLNSEFGGYSQFRFIPNIGYNISGFNALEKEVIDKVIEKLSDMTAKQISEYSHNDIPYLVSKNIGDKISYQQVFYRVGNYITNFKNDE